MRLIFSTEDENTKETFRHVLLKVIDCYTDRPQVNGKDVPAELLFLDDDDKVEYPEKSRFISAFLSENDIGLAPPIPAGEGNEDDDKSFEVTEK